MKFNLKSHLKVAGKMNKEDAGTVGKMLLHQATVLVAWCF